MITTSIRSRAVKAVRGQRVIRRCEAPKPSSSAPSEEGTVFHGGNTYTAAEFAEAEKTGNFKPAPASPIGEAVETPVPTIGKLMAFDGPAPETINGRLAMLGFVAAVGAELSSGQTIFSQIGEAPAPILITFITFAIASLLPLAQNQMPESRANSFFSASAEMLNGRAAMLGFAFLVVSELFTGQAFFQ